jgi:hypothetical protein
MPAGNRIGWREPTIILGIISLIVAGAAFGRDLLDFTLSDSHPQVTAGAGSPPTPVPTVVTTDPDTTSTPEGYDPDMPTDEAFSSGVVAIATEGIDLDSDPPQPPSVSGGDAEFRTTATAAFSTKARIYQWDEAGSPTEGQCVGGVDAMGAAGISVGFGDLKEGTWAFCLRTSEGRYAYIVIAGEAAASVADATSRASYFVW